MLKSLTIKNFILLKSATLDFTNGFNVLCGETGAGKSIIIKALDSVLGAKVNKEVVFDKNLPCYIEATFVQDGVETVISREISSQSKFRLNGMLSSQEEIKELRESLVDIHSQHQTYSYMQPKHHIHLLDDYIIKKSPEFAELLKSYKENYVEFRDVEKKLNLLKENLENNEKEIEFLEFQLKELDDAAVRQNEEEEINEELNILSNVQELKEGSYSAYWALCGDNDSIVEALGKIKYSISSLAELDKNLAESQSALFDAFEGLKDAGNYLRDYSSSLELNPARIDELNERISLIQKLKRKYGADLDFERDKIDARLKELTSGDNNIEALEENYNTLLSNLDMLCDALEDYRIKNGLELSKLIEEKLKSLELKEAQFEIAVKKVSKNDFGSNSVEFMISTNKNQSPAPLSKVASGGEISRVMLALKTIFALVDKVQTVVFDEIDTGISGITSNAVANSMIELAQLSQIICITHQPIICAKANNFIWITKTHNEDTDIKIEILDDNKRLEALAQLASGEVTQQTIDFAKTLIK
ncbi:MAG: DNA repair protein RecN [Candidatus Gastranaerophilales bacterium]|nr:DNA repair protein RecN [Candidatus Gastranaerophilales bacterium]